MGSGTDEFLARYPPVSEPSKLIIGLTGGIGSGKSAATAIFESFGIKVVDADIVAREVVEPGSPALAEIAKHFGDNFILESGDLNRAALREKIFANEQDKHWLESLLHPLIRSSIEHQLSEATSPYAILVSPLLFETDQSRLTARTLLIDAPEALQIERASERDNSKADQIKSIIAQQMDRHSKQKLADDIILNDGSIESLRAAVVQHHHAYMELARDRKDTTKS